MRNLVIFDLETTGLDKTKHQIIQFAAIKIDVDTNKLIDSKNILIQPIGNYEISLLAYFKHGITAKDLADKPYLKDVAQEIIDFIDIPFLKYELNKYGFDIDFMNRPCYDAFLEEKRRNSNNLENTYLRYSGKTMEEAGLKAHDALSDVKATYSVFWAQQKHQAYGPENMYGEDNVITDQLFKDEIKPCFNIGKYRGYSLEYVITKDKGYLAWCISDSCNFTQSTKDYIKQFIQNN